MNKSPDEIKQLYFEALQAVKAHKIVYDSHLDLTNKNDLTSKLIFDNKHTLESELLISKDVAKINELCHSIKRHQHILDTNNVSAYQRSLEFKRILEHQHTLERELVSAHNLSLELERATDERAYEIYELPCFLQVLWNCGTAALYCMGVKNNQGINIQPI